MKSRTNFGGFLSEPLKVVVAIFLTTLLATASYANETSSAIRGVVTDGGGAGIEGAQSRLSVTRLRSQERCKPTTKVASM
ncbi:MAG: hypothetical protein JJ921_00915 [Pseudomonadales bacterium]|nr:hypothetical protein [Pseudomonadales bacterium]MBO7004811.1 hypothetical protein [Pseudomonadales bacterium]